ncbi:hypothetical protein ACEPAG_2918 [Sanghuangporus baumii]
MPPFSPSNLASVEDNGASSDVPDDSVLIEGGVNLALTSPFIFLGLTILGLVGLLLLLMYCSYRIIRSRQLKNGGIVPSLKPCPFRIVALSNQFQGAKNGTNTSSDTSVKAVSSSLSAETTRTRLGYSASGSMDVKEKDITELSPIARNQSVVHIDQNSPNCIQGKCGCLYFTRTVRLVPVEATKSNDAPYLPLQADKNSSSSLLGGIGREYADIVSEMCDRDAVLSDSAALQRVQIDRPDFITREQAFEGLESTNEASLPLAVGSTVKKYKAPLSVEAKTRRMTKSSSTPVSESPRTPSRSRSSTPLPPGSPRTPRTPIRSQSRCDDTFMESEMDVSRVDPEQALVDAENVDVDLSFELDEHELRSLQYGREDKVHVSIRVRPTDETQAWTISPAESSLRLLPKYHKSTGAPLPQYHYDEVLIGSDNKAVYNATARGHVEAAMNGFNAVVFAYGQTASGKTFTLSGSEEQPGIIPCAMKDVFGHIRRIPSREYLLRCSYLEIYNESIFDLLAPPSARLAANTVQIQGIGENVILSPLREEVVTSLKGVHDVLERGYANRRTASTDWNERSSRSHSVFRLVIESRERGSPDASEDGRSTPFAPQTPGGARLQSKNGRSVQMSVLSLIDLAGSEKASSDKDRTREGRYINTSLLTLGSVIGTLAENSAKGKNDHVPFRNSKLTRMLQPSLSGNARISVICTINPVPSAVAETTSSLLFAQRVKRVQLHAKKKEVVDTGALLERYRKEIEDLKRRLAEREAIVPAQSRRLSAKEQLDESRAMHDLNSRIQQLTRLILTSQSVDETKGDQSRPSSPSRLNFDLEPYQLQQELLSARGKIESQATQILSLEAALLARPELPVDAPENEKDKLITEQIKTIRELELVVRGYEENLGEPLRAVKDGVEAEWHARLEEERKAREEKAAWAGQLVCQLEEEKSKRLKLEEECRALAAFVSCFDSLGVASDPAIPSRLRKPTLPFSSKFFASRRRTSAGLTAVSENVSPLSLQKIPASPEKFAQSIRATPNLFDTDEPDFSELAEFDPFSDASVQRGLVVNDSRKYDDCLRSSGDVILPESDQMKISVSPREALQDKENMVP